MILKVNFRTRVKLFLILDGRNQKNDQIKNRDNSETDNN